MLNEHLKVKTKKHKKKASFSDTVRLFCRGIKTITLSSAIRKQLISG